MCRVESQIEAAHGIVVSFRIVIRSACGEGPKQVWYECVTLITKVTRRNIDPFFTPSFHSHAGLKVNNAISIQTRSRPHVRRLLKADSVPEEDL